MKNSQCQSKYCKIIGSIMLVAIGIMKEINMIVIPKENMG
jgi:hypothetical protein